MSHMSTRTIERWIKSGALRSVEIGSARRIVPADCLCRLEAQADGWDKLQHAAGADRAR